MCEAQMHTSVVAAGAVSIATWGSLSCFDARPMPSFTMRTPKPGRCPWAQLVYHDHLTTTLQKPSGDRSQQSTGMRTRMVLYQKCICEVSPEHDPISGSNRCTQHKVVLEIQPQLLGNTTMFSCHLTQCSIHVTTQDDDNIA